MSKSWIKAKHSEFIRDILRDFCLVSRELEICFHEYDTTGAIDFPSLRDLIGEEMNKGLLWRLKDTSHHIFRNETNCNIIGKFLDWGLGYIFHETMKLKEDAYQQRMYAPWVKELDEQQLSESELIFCKKLNLVLFQTGESIDREITRIRFITRQCLDMFPLYYKQHCDNPLLARFLVGQNSLVIKVFKEHYADLISHVYAAQPETMYLLAAQSLRQGGWYQEAAWAVKEGLAIMPAHSGLLEEKKIIDTKLQK